MVTPTIFSNFNFSLPRISFTFIDKNKYYLRINADNIRTEIIDLKNIQDFCINNKIDKNNSFINFTQKNLYSDKSIIDFDDFNFRISYNLEKNLDKNDEKEIGRAHV